MSHVTCNLPLHPIPFNHMWNYLSNLQLADPGFTHPGRIDFVLVVDMFIKALLPGQHVGLIDSSAALEMEFVCFLLGELIPAHQLIMSHPIISPNSLAMIHCIDSVR